MAIRRELNPIDDPLCHVVHEVVSRIAIARGDEWTGMETVPDGKPSTQHAKGTATQLAVETNRQYSLFDDIPVADTDGIDIPMATWVLLHFRDQHKIRCELSLPSAINKSGFVEAWTTRIILTEIE